MDMNQQINQNNLNLNNANKKKVPPIVGLIIGIFILIAVVIGGFSLFSKKEEKDTNGNENTNTNENNENNKNQEEDACAGNAVVLTGLKGETVDYYYNIDTSKFDKSKFDGKINFLGSTIDGKITSNKIKKAGITFTCGIFEDKELTIDYFGNKGYSYCNPNFSVETSSDITNPDASGMTDPYNTIEIRDYTNSPELYSDTGIVFVGYSGIYGWNLSARNIYPNQLGIEKYSDITIDLILEKLGNPTYVVNRTSPCLKSEYSHIAYVYVYDDVAFLFAFATFRNMALASVFYYPYERYKDDIPSLIEGENLYKSNK